MASMKYATSRDIVCPCFSRWGLKAGCPSRIGPHAAAAVDRGRRDPGRFLPTGSAGAPVDGDAREKRCADRSKPRRRGIAGADAARRRRDLFIQCGEKEVHRAIEIVGKARSDSLTHTLIDFLMGEPDGVPKDPNYIYRLYLALGNFPQAAKTAVIIARQEQDLGSYKAAHAIL